MKADCYTLVPSISKLVLKPQAELTFANTINQILVDLHGGHIDMKNEVGVGTTFTIMLPSVK